MKYLKNNWPYSLIILFAFFLRFFKLAEVPSSLYYDEIDLGYQVESILQTGKDYRGDLSPFYTRSFNTDKAPLPIWFSAPFSLLFQVPELQVRSGTAAAGVIVVALSMGLASLLFRSKATTIITGLVFASSPWLIHFSRLTFEAQFALLTLFLYLAFLFSWLKNKQEKYIFWSVVSLGLSVYTYRTMSFLSPILFVSTYLFFASELKSLGIKKILLLVATFGILFLPFIYATTIGAKDQTRISQISIFSDPKIAIEVQRSRELVSGDFADPTPGQQANLQSKVFHNKLLSYLDRFTTNTLNNFSPNFLFLVGDGNGRHSAKNTGQLLTVDLIGLLFGTYFIFTLKDKRIKFLLFVLLLGAVPANLTLDGQNHASRLITFAGPLLLVVSFGYAKFFEVISRVKFKNFVGLGLAMVWLFFLFRFLNTYFYHFPVTNSREFGYGYKQAVLKIESIKKDYDKVYLSGVNDPPMLYYFFWSKTDPKKVQEYGTEYGDNIIKNTELDKVKPFYPTDLLCKEKEIEKLDPKTLYLVGFRNLPMDFRSADKDPVPQGIKLVDVIKYPDNEIAYYLITRDTKDGKLVKPLKDQTCK